MRKYMKSTTAVFFSALLVLAGLFGCDADVQQEGKAPDVDVETTGGQLPEFEQTQEAELPDVDVTGTPGEAPEVDVRGPNVDVKQDTVEVPVPDVDVDVPQEEENEPPKL